MIKLAITGGIGSGKSLVCDSFKSAGVPVFNCDETSRRILYENKDKIVSIFGDGVLKDGNLDRPSLGRIVFADKEQLKKLTDILHPLVHIEMEKFYDKHKSENLCVVENAILFESGTQGNFDYIMTVAADEEIRIERAMARDKASREDVKMRIDNQLSQQYKIDNSNFVIYNNGTQFELNLQVANVYETLINKK